MSYAMDLARNGWKGNKRMVNSKALGFASRASGKAAGMLGKTALNPIGGLAIFGAVAGVLSHDPTKNTMSSHMSQEFVKMAADVPFDAALFGVGSLLGGPIGGMIGLGVSVGLNAMGATPGQMIGKMMNNAGDSYKRQKGMGLKSITQNEMTMRATQQGLSMLGSTTRHNLLGNEAQIMHN
jgi:hypothetical protein